MLGLLLALCRQRPRFEGDVYAEWLHAKTCDCRNESTVGVGGGNVAARNGEGIERCQIALATRFGNAQAATRSSQCAMQQPRAKPRLTNGARVLPSAAEQCDNPRAEIAGDESGGRTRRVMGPPPCQSDSHLGFLQYLHLQAQAPGSPRLVPRACVISRRARRWAIAQAEAPPPIGCPTKRVSHVRAMCETISGISRKQLALMPSVVNTPHSSRYSHEEHAEPTVDPDNMTIMQTIAFHSALLYSHVPPAHSNQKPQTLASFSCAPIWAQTSADRHSRQHDRRLETSPRAHTRSRSDSKASAA